MVEVVEEVGLITCERVVYRHGAILLIVREWSGFILGGFDHMEVDEQDREQVDSERK